MLPLVVQIEKTEQHVADTVAFDRSPVRIGRNPLNDLPLQEAFVSQWHCVVRFSEGRTTVLDLGSTNRTQVDGKVLERNVEVAVDHRSDVRIGTLRLHFLRVQAPPELFGRRRDSAFASVGNPEQGDLGRTMYVGDRVPKEGSAAQAPVSAEPPAQAAAPAVAAKGQQPARAPAPAHAKAKDAAAAAAPDALQDAYASYRSAWESFFATVKARLEAASPKAREEEMLALLARFPQLAREPELRDYVASTGINPLKTGEPQMEEWLRRLTNGLFPPPGAGINIALAMERVGEILEVFAQAFVELRDAHEQFCKEMSLQRYADHSTMQRSGDARVVLAYLLNPSQDGAQRPRELARAMADIAVHQVALVAAVVEGSRDLLDNLSPDALEKAPDPPAQSPVLREEGMLARLWPQATHKLWRRFAATHHDLVENDRFTRTLFGRAFARRYYAILGSSGAD